MADVSFCYSSIVQNTYSVATLLLFCRDKIGILSQLSAIMNGQAMLSKVIDLNGLNR